MIEEILLSWRLGFPSSEEDMTDCDVNLLALQIQGVVARPYRKFDLGVKSVECGQARRKPHGGDWTAPLSPAARRV